jgi:hypothetical protein
VNYFTQLMQEKGIQLNDRLQKITSKIEESQVGAISVALPLLAEQNLLQSRAAIPATIDRKTGRLNKTQWKHAFEVSLAVTNRSGQKGRIP